VQVLRDEVQVVREGQRRVAQAQVEEMQRQQREERRVAQVAACVSVPAAAARDSAHTHSDRNGLR
jgi:hypothetical protein